ncbi:cytochrome p450 domain-containing protein [Hirsutella rhossiliensis]|uniref:Cytochrome p450 domain-containing protein n=1 Tax=Hirsutella rhossiliensis TaxID=111463 RepID=A0A9P8MUB1_9HYPO|nr:cytochrome p450 domain-containing protein [Hirsutella rhossiliensis]KAH0960569.1 cytochrome p450 domain-containing protein [Hirsutella rhossiliensis]
MLLSLPYALAALSLVVVVGLVRRLSSPLRRLPGPPSSLLTSLVLRWRELNAGRTAYIHKLHQRYGPVVRIAPNEVSFTSWPALKEIYCSGGSGYDKSSFYDLFKVYGRRTMFTMLNKTDHAGRKRLLADRYANSSVMQAAPMQGIQELSRAFLRRCTSVSKSKTSEVFKVDEDMMHQSTADDSLQNRLISHYSPTLHRLLASFLTLFVKPREVPLVDDYILETSKCRDTASFTLLSRLGQKEELDAIDVAAECLDHVVAGIDTTGDSLCFLMWELSQPRSLPYQRRLTQELQNNPGAPVDQLSFLDAIVHEGLRCYPPIPMSLPRLVPPGGRTIDGFWLPEQTIVSCQAYSVHRINMDVFPEPDTFDPDRWLGSDGEIDRQRLLFAFANGGRGCVGKHLALAEMKTLLRDVYSKFGTTPDASMNEESMAMYDQLISTRPLGQRCLLQFNPLEDTVEGGTEENDWETDKPLR